LPPQFATKELVVCVNELNRDVTAEVTGENLYGG